MNNLPDLSNPESSDDAMTFSRRNLLLGAGVAGLSVMLGTPSIASAAAKKKATKVRVAMGWIKNVEYGGSWVALENGYYAAESIDAEYLQGGPNAPTPMVSVAAGDADIGVTPNLQAFLQAISKGNDFVAVGTQYQASPGGVLSLIKRPIREPKDLVGSKFLGQDGVDTTINAVLTKAGLPKDYTFVKAGFSPDPLLEGAGDAYSCFVVNQPITLETKGLVKDKDFVVTTWAALGLPSYANLVFCKRSYLQKNRATVAKFMKATIKGWEMNAKDTSVAPKLAVEKYGVDLSLDIKQQTRQNELQVALMNSPLTASKGIFRMDSKLLAGDMYTALKAAGITDLPDPTKVLDLKLLDEVYGKKKKLT